MPVSPSFSRGPWGTSAPCAARAVLLPRSMKASRARKPIEICVTSGTAASGIERTARIYRGADGTAVHGILLVRPRSKKGTSLLMAAGKLVGFRRVIRTFRHPERVFMRRDENDLGSKYTTV
jgi:hypothetical protein